MAKNAFRRALDIAPADPDALNLYGAMLVETGDATGAIPYLERAVQLKRNNPALVGNLAHAYFALGRYVEAGETFRKAVRLDPRALPFQIGLANSLAMQGQLTTAEELLNKLASRFPDSTLVQFNLGNVQRDGGSREKAIESFRRAINVDPQFVDARNSLASVLHTLLQFDAAEREYRECIRIAPGYLIARCNLASVVMDLGRFDEAAQICRDVIARAPDLPLAYSFLGAALEHRGRLLDALTCHAKAAELSPVDGKIAQNYASGLADCGQFFSALAWFNRALNLSPDLASTHLLRAYTLLGHGSITEGWHEYAHRPWPQVFRDEHPDLPLSSALPDRLRDSHVHVVKEQGLGDEIFFLRYAPQLQAAGTRITYCASPKILSLLARTPFFAAVTEEVKPPAGADAVILAGDLPRALNNLPASALPVAQISSLQPPPKWGLRISVHWPEIPKPLPLSPLEERIAAVRQRLAKSGNGPYIGLTWRGGIPPADQRGVIWSLHKEIELPAFGAALHRTPGTFLVLQRNPGSAELSALTKTLGRPLQDFSDLNEDLEDMLALLTIIDDYIGVSNTNMHLRAAVGKSARVLIPAPPEWRWMMNHAPTSPWFPGFAVYRQALTGDWSPALAALKNDLISRFGERT